MKIVVLMGNRLIKNLLFPTVKFKDNRQLINEPIIALSESELWNTNDNKDNWILTAGKIENLRIAARKLNGIEIKANKVFSFWKHIGNSNFGKGYVTGREIREGCIVPTIGGGLCQLSNALYDAALNANFEIVERHKHTKVIKGSLAEQNRDATVKWNYIDLRFKSSADFRIEVILTSEKLVVTFRSNQKNIKSTDDKFNFRNSNKLNDCYSCGNLVCFKHPDKTSENQKFATTTFILDEKWSEYDEYIKEIATPSDSFILPLNNNWFIKATRYSWSAANLAKTKATNFQGIYRAVKLRLAAKKNNNNVFKLALELDKKIALAAARHIPLESTHLVISQNLLPFIYESGVLGGRTFDVIMTRLPFEKLHERLDFAFSNHPESLTLNDFRATKELIDIENMALTKARKIITPHSEIAEFFKNKVVKLKWHIPPAVNYPITGKKVLFPASAVGRKGAYEIRKIAAELNFHLTISGRASEYDNFWGDLNIELFNGDFNQVGLIVYPTYIEHQPRQILKAMALGIPVITTKACGLDVTELVKIVELNNFHQLKTEVYRQTKKGETAFLH